jgi:hypothetical protein
MLRKLIDTIKAPKQALSRTAEVGWVLDTDQAGFIWDAPRRLSSDHPPAKHAKSVAFCPAMIDYESRIYEIPCPIDVQLRIAIDEKTKQPTLVNAAGDQSTIRNRYLGQMAVMINRAEWRHPDRPVVQIATPYLFVSDEPIYMSQMPPFQFRRTPALPGVVIGGRMPIHIWPRHMMWAFEWYDPKAVIELKRGEPWFYVRFETHDPSRPVRLVEAEMVPALKEYMHGARSVTNYVNRTFSLFKTAQTRRPSQLLFKKKRD